MALPISTSLHHSKIVTNYGHLLEELLCLNVLLNEMISKILVSIYNAVFSLRHDNI